MGVVVALVEWVIFGDDAGIDGCYSYHARCPYCRAAHITLKERLTAAAATASAAAAAHCAA